MPNQTRQRNLILWTAACIGVAVIFLTYAAVSLAGGHGDVLMPLDDVYIHFQYARQLALGEPYIYNPGQPPTSGATSFLYPHVLASGYLLGFHELKLGLWAMIIGALALLASMIAMYRIGNSLGLNWKLSAIAAASFALMGSINWHFMSGMETGLMIAFTLWTLYSLLVEQPRYFAIAASLLALTRPEGSIMAVIASLLSLIFLWRSTANKRQLLWYLLPIIALLIQPLVNWLVTGTVVASGSQAKSLLGLVPRQWSVIISRILENFVGMWVEFVTGYAPREGWYLPVGLGLLAIGGIISLIFGGNRVFKRTALIVLIWTLAVSAAIATLDTAFWHFKRYQMPIIVLFVPLAMYALYRLKMRVKPFKFIMWSYAGLILPFFAIALLVQFLTYHYHNITYVYAQPLQMARWLATNTPEDAVIAVHDVGMMRYMGNRTTLDMVGLTTPGAAAYWRNGPGSVAEYLIRQQPDYIASYGVGHGYGLRLLAETQLYDNIQAEFPVELDPHLNVALAANYQAIYQPDWESIKAARQVNDAMISEAEALLGPDVQYAPVPMSSAIPSINYEWRRDADILSFPSVVYEFDNAACVEETCIGSVHGGRAVNWERIRLEPLQDGNSTRDVLVIVRVHALNAAYTDVFVTHPALERTHLTTKVIAAIPGKWQDIPIWIPSELVPDETWLDVELVSDTGYESFAYWVFTGNHIAIDPPEQIDASYQNESFALVDMQPTQVDEQLKVNFNWYSSGASQGDLRFFVHLYDDINEPPVVQWDGYLSGGPVGNWLPGMRQDTVMVNLHEIMPGTYTLAIGFYNPQEPAERPVPASSRYDVLEDGRLILGDVIIE